MFHRSNTFSQINSESGYWNIYDFRSTGNDRFSGHRFSRKDRCSGQIDQKTDHFRDKIAGFIYWF